LKQAADGREGFVARFYGPHGGRGEVTVHLPPGITRVVETNLIEEDGDLVETDDGAFRFHIAPFAVKTFRLVPG
jgi:alpha-mannosidase